MDWSEFLKKPEKYLNRLLEDKILSLCMNGTYEVIYRFESDNTVKLNFYFRNLKDATDYVRTLYDTNPNIGHDDLFIKYGFFVDSKNYIG
ncbi:hypothetical protein J4468_03420 [Candidatus Woesearchaeota archaeon]|nr:hypothetical protein [Candidatus Woesearchaeota archaeon]